MRSMNPLWRKIFDTSLSTTWGHHIDRVIEVIKASGYPLFNWNGDVYKTPKDGEESLAHFLFKEDDLG